MAQVKKGSKVKIQYTGKLKDGIVFESNIGRAPLEFVVGKGKVIKGFENAVIGMSPGQSKTVTLKPAEAYGAKDPELIIVVPKEELPGGMHAEVGQDVVAFTRADGTVVEGQITAVDGDAVTIDGNHPLAGKSLIFEIKLLSL